MPLDILITGANSGFGLLMTHTFASQGHTVHAGYRNPDKVGELNELASAGLPVRPVRIDVTDNATILAGVAEKPIDVLVNNAGFEVRCPIDQLSDAMIHKQFDTNVTGVIRMIRAVSPGMRERRSGTIINISSIVGTITLPYNGAYSASKHAVEAISETLWAELAPFGVRVAVVAPGVFKTNFAENIVTDPSFDETSDHWPNALRFSAALRGFTSRGEQPPQEVADIVLAIATGKDVPSLRHFAGDDVRRLVPLYRSQDFEAYSKTIYGALGLADWRAAP